MTKEYKRKTKKCEQCNHDIPLYYWDKHQDSHAKGNSWGGNRVKPVDAENQRLKHRIELLQEELQHKDNMIKLNENRIA